MNTPVPKASRVLSLVCALLTVGSAAWGQEGGGTSAQGAPDPCDLLNEAKASALVGAPLQHEPVSAVTELRLCAYRPRVPSDKGVTGLEVVTYQSIDEPSALFEQMKAECVKPMHFRPEPDLGPLTVSCVQARTAQVSGFKGRVGLMVQVAGTSSELGSLARRGFELAVKMLP